MKTVPRRILLMCLCAALSIFAAKAQSPTPIIVQAASPSASQVAAPPPVLAGPDSSSLGDAIKLLQQIKAANAETLKKQQAALEQLDDLQKAAEQIKTFAHRG